MIFLCCDYVSSLFDFIHFYSWLLISVSIAMVSEKEWLMRGDGTNGREDAPAYGNNLKLNQERSQTRFHDGRINLRQPGIQQSIILTIQILKIAEKSKNALLKLFFFRKKPPEIQFSSFIIKKISGEKNTEIRKSFKKLIVAHQNRQNCQYQDYPSSSVSCRLSRAIQNLLSKTAWYGGTTFCRRNR